MIDHVYTAPEKALVAHVGKSAKVRCGSRPPVTRMVTRDGLTKFYQAYKWKSDGRWHFNLIGEIT